MKQDKWHGCYEDGWQGDIVPEAFAHPAKMAYGLLQRIYAHCFEWGWLKEGDVVVDPFGGIGSTGILGAYRGVQVVSCELEAKFTGLAMHNMFLHLPRWRALGSPLPVIIQGDSRRLCELVGGADCVAGSPPFYDVNIGRPHYGASQVIDGNSDRNWIQKWEKGKRDKTKSDYGTTPGQLGSMKAGSVEAVISSPPWQEGKTTCGGPGPGWSKTLTGANDGPLTNHGDTHIGYGSTPGNLGNLKPGDCEVIVSSPPYEGSEGSPSLGSANKDNWGNEGTDIVSRRGLSAQYGKSDGQLGHTQGPTFWAAAKEIVQQCHQILRPGGHAIWVVKDFIRKGQKVDFTGDWRRLCESIGFETVCVHHAMLVKESKHKTLFGDTHTERTERKSFFRRLAEAKGCPPINYETVLCMRKQGCEDGK